VVSNGQGWYECDGEYLQSHSQANSPPILPPPGARAGQQQEEPLGALRKKANRFYCYDKSDSYEWVECPAYGTGDFENEGSYSDIQNEGLKLRLVGDGLYKLADSFPEPFDFTGYDQLEFLVRFVDGQGNPTTPEYTPFGVKLEIFGPDETLYFEDNVLGYATNAVFVKEGDNEYHLPGDNWQDKWIHVKVDLPPNLIGVEGIRIAAIPEGNKIEF
jgi:hypothetical protein